DYENNRLIELGEPDPNNAWRPRLRVADQPPTERDMEGAGVLNGSVIALGAQQRNPVIRLRQRGRRLFWRGGCIEADCGRWGSSLPAVRVWPVIKKLIQ